MQTFDDGDDQEMVKDQKQKPKEEKMGKIVVILWIVCIYLFKTGAI